MKIHWLLVHANLKEQGLQVHTIPNLDLDLDLYKLDYWLDNILKSMVSIF